MSERQYNASVDLHDSYYAAVAELRQQYEAGLPIVRPETMKVEQAKAEAIIAYAATMKDWPLLEQAIALKIEQQDEFVRWWDERVQRKGRP